MKTPLKTGLVWFRRDLRIDDNAALATALQQCERVHCVFVFDEDILDSLPRADRRVEFIQASVAELDASLRATAGDDRCGLITLHDRASEAVVTLASALGVQAVFAGKDYEPAALKRDAIVSGALRAHSISFNTTKDHVIFEEREVLTQTGRPYGVYTPYQRAWYAKLGDVGLPRFASVDLQGRLLPRPQLLSAPVPSLQALGFEATNLSQLAIPTGASGAQRLLEGFWERISGYEETRNFPSIKGPSYLGVHLRFGTVSIRTLVHLALQLRAQGDAGAAVWLNELVWRDFYFQILANFPHVANGAYKPEYDAIRWVDGDLARQRFAAWCAGQTGYPLVDAAMAQINATGYMHNRLRMVAGSFLVKHLGLDWRWGERYFAQHLNDFDQSANNGGWQWVSSSGCDAQPYFRIFNPVSQSEKFDAQGKFINRYLPQLEGLSDKAIHAPWLAKPLELAAAGVRLGENYPMPIVHHAQARADTLARYAVVKKTV